MQPDVSTSSPAKLECSFELTPAHDLKVKVKVWNRGAADLFVLNHLWKMSSDGHDVDDPEQVYRFVRDAELRLLWGIAPLPRLKSTMYRNVPFATAVKPQSSLAWEYSAKVPIAEYNVYFSDSHGAAHQSSRVKRVVVIVDVVAAKAGVTTTPSGLGSSIKVSTPEAVGAHQSIVCASGVIELETLRRTDSFSRFNMPNEKPEPLVLAP